MRRAGVEGIATGVDTTTAGAALVEGLVVVFGNGRYTI